MIRLIDRTASIQYFRSIDPVTLVWIAVESFGNPYCIIPRTLRDLD